MEHPHILEHQSLRLVVVEEEHTRTPHRMVLVVQVDQVVEEQGPHPQEQVVPQREHHSQEQ